MSRNLVMYRHSTTEIIKFDVMVHMVDITWWKWLYRQNTMKRAGLTLKHWWLIFLLLFPGSPFLCDRQSKFSSVFDQSSLLQLPTTPSDPKGYDKWLELPCKERAMLTSRALCTYCLVQCCVVLLSCRTPAETLELLEKQVQSGPVHLSEEEFGQFICRDCTLVDHAGHRYNFVKAVADSFRA